jgi:hypothetical protein
VFLGVRVKDEADMSDGHEAARLLVAWLKHVEAYEKSRREADEKIVVVLPDTEVAERRRKAKPRATRSGRPKKPAKTSR